MISKTDLINSRIAKVRARGIEEPHCVICGDIFDEPNYAMFHPELTIKSGGIYQSMGHLCTPCHQYVNGADDDAWVVYANSL